MIEEIGSPDRSAERRIADAVDHSEIRRLLDAYADLVSRRDWPALGELFVADTELYLDLRHTTRVLAGAAEIGGFLGPAVERFEFFQFVILGMTVDLRVGGDPDAARGRTYMSELRQDGATHEWSQIHGIYHDEFVRTSEGWRIARRHYHSMARRAAGETTAEVFPFPELPGWT